MCQYLNESDATRHSTQISPTNCIEPPVIVNHSVAPFRRYTCRCNPTLGDLKPSQTPSYNLQKIHTHLKIFRTHINVAAETHPKAIPPRLQLPFSFKERERTKNWGLCKPLIITTSWYIVTWQNQIGGGSLTKIKKMPT